MTEDDYSLTRRIGRMAHVAGTLGGAAFKTLGAKLIGNQDEIPSVLTEALGRLKGPAMKVGQILSMVPGILPDEIASSLMQLQSNAPAMGWPFVRRRMAFELGENWQDQFSSFEREAAAAASLGQVHKAELLSGEHVACKLQYPNMLNIVQGDLDQLKMLLGMYEYTSGVIDTAYIQQELKDRLLEELDYHKELCSIMQFQDIFNDSGLSVKVPKPFKSYSTGRLLTMEWMEGESLMTVKTWPLELRKIIAERLFQAWYYPLYRYGILHGDPHFGNYRITREGEIILFDFGCVRNFSSDFLQGVMRLYRALETNNKDQAMSAYESWGFTNLTSEVVEALNIWAKFLYGPLLEDRVRPLVESPQEGKIAAKMVLQALKNSGKVQPPKEFVFMDRAAVGIGAAMIHLDVELNWHQLFHSLLPQMD